MAVGEGFVLTAIYAFIDTLPEGEIRTLMSGLARQEEGHVNFGEEQTLKALARRPGLAPHLLGLTLAAMLGVRAIARYTSKRFGDHPVLRRMPAFLEHSNRVTELRLAGSGSSIARSPRSARESAPHSSPADASRYARVVNPFRRKPAKLTKTYLADPGIMGRFQARRPLRVRLSGRFRGDQSPLSVGRHIHMTAAVIDRARQRDSPLLDPQRDHHVEDHDRKREGDPADGVERTLLTATSSASSTKSTSNVDEVPAEEVHNGTPRYPFAVSQRYMSPRNQSLPWSDTGSTTRSTSTVAEGAEQRDHRAGACAESRRSRSTGRPT